MRYRFVGTSGSVYLVEFIKDQGDSLQCEVLAIVSGPTKYGFPLRVGDRPSLYKHLLIPTSVIEVANELKQVIEGD